MKSCSVDGCSNKMVAKGYCSGHYQQMKNGSVIKPLHVRGWQMLKFLESNLDTASQECIGWPFWKNNKGYGIIHFGGRKHVASRFMCEMKHGAAPDPEMQAAHSCGNGHLGCINPNHLSWKTVKENHEDKKSHGTWLHGESQNGARLTRDDVIFLRGLYAKGVPMKNLYKLYPQLHPATVRSAVLRINWRWLEDTLEVQK